MREEDVIAQTIEDRMVTDLDDHQRRQLTELLQRCVVAMGGPSSD
ncbi:hypothetical protein [Actinomadura madurae]|nr:hypothetical protein [Actinomadura madurae]